MPEVTAFGFVSAIQGSYTPEQVLLDISAGTRTNTTLYDRDLPSGIALAPRGAGGQIERWGEIVDRADTPPADIVPGTLGQSVRDGGGRVAYVGGRRGPNREAIVAADRAGRIDRVSVGSRTDVGTRAVAAWRDASLMVVRLPAGAVGRKAIDAVLAARRAPDLVFVVQGPSALRRSLLAAGAAGLAGGRNLRSDSTRTDGLVLTTDFAPTVLERLGLTVPDGVTGQPIEARGSRSVADLSAFRERLGAIGNHRWSIVAGSLALSVLLIAAATRGRRRSVGRGALAGRALDARRDARDRRNRPLGSGRARDPGGDLGGPRSPHRPPAALAPLDRPPGGGHRGRPRGRPGVRLGTDRALAARPQPADRRALLRDRERARDHPGGRDAAGTRRSAGRNRHARDRLGDFDRRGSRGVPAQLGPAGRRRRRRTDAWPGRRDGGRLCGRPGVVAITRGDRAGRARGAHWGCSRCWTWRPAEMPISRARCSGRAGSTRWRRSRSDDWSSATHRSGAVWWAHWW